MNLRIRIQNNSQETSMPQQVFKFLIFIALALSGSFQAHAQAYPAKPRTSSVTRAVFEALRT